jgi:biotin carboxylase
MSTLLRFSDTPSRFETTHDRLKDLADYFGVSQNKAAAYAINLLWEQLQADDELAAGAAFTRQGTKIGGIHYLGLSADEADELRAKAARTQARAAQGVPAPHIDDDEITRNMFFGLLPQDVQDAIRAEADPVARRQRFQAAVDAALAEDE